VDALGAPQRVTGGGVEQLRWPRSFGGIPAVDDELRVDLAANGAVLTAIGTADDAAPATLTPALGPAAAMRVARAGGQPQVVAGPSGARRDTRFAGGGRARLVVFAGRLAWRVDYPASPAAFYDTIVDAAGGAILHRANLVRGVTTQANVWADFPSGAPMQADLVTTTSTALSNEWLHVFSDANGNDTADAGEEVAPGRYDLDTSFSGPGCTLAKPCTWDPNTANSWTGNRQEEAVQAFYLANVYRQHLAADPFDFDGFDAANDHQLRIETDWGIDHGITDNSSMLTVPPGAVDNQGNPLYPTMSLYLFDNDGGFRAMSGAMDASILFHEYTHGYNDSMVVDSDGFEQLDTAQAWALDEASADFFAKSFLVDGGLETDTAAAGEVDMGNYTDVTPDSIRAEPLDCPVGTQDPACPGHGYTYADFGHVWAFGPEPHYDGEIWAETMWDLRGALGAVKAVQLAAHAFRDVPNQPSFLDMRDAILRADPADAATIWSVFAKRGMGCDAATNGSDDTAPQAGFSVSCPAGPQPAPQPTSTPQPTPSATPVPVPPAPARPSFVLKSSGHRALVFTVSCHTFCNVTGTLRVDKRTAKRLKLGSRRIVGTLTGRLTAAGTRTFTVRLNSAAAKALKRARKVSSFKATLTVQARYPGALVASQHRTVTVKR
jgi:extracellular elastinolytic metalloproteinase